MIDERRRGGQRHGQILLLGSASIDLRWQASETLAGRVAYLDIGPVAAAAGYQRHVAWLRSGFPESLLAKDDRTSLRWRLDFIRSYLERVVAMFAPRLPGPTIGRLWTMLANGQGSRHWRAGSASQLQRSDAITTC